VKRDHGRRRALGQGTEVERFETLTQVVQVEVAVDLGSDLGVGVAEDPLHDRERHLRLDEQGGHRVAQIVEAQLADDRLEPAQPPTCPEPTAAAASPTQDPEPATVRRQPDSRSCGVTSSSASSAKTFSLAPAAPAGRSSPSSTRGQ